ncbi:putative motility protein [Pseudomonas sp. 8Z]|uniref:putative motility protein n=1 Tax=Pseudomonas sp. 8Z TaxID=2653166 RepID=UPI00211479AF|nr:putative motility protein [Pseudomonas sp. 8Z]
MESNSVASQASTQIAAQMSLVLLRKTLDQQTANMTGAVQAAPAATAPSNPPNLGNSIDVIA